MHSIRGMSRFFRKLWRDLSMTRSRARRPWVALAFNSARMATEAQHVMLLRLTKIGFGAGGSWQEIQRMTSEKPAAFANAHLAAAMALATGSKDHVAAKQALRVYRRAVRANLRRLQRKRG